MKNVVYYYNSVIGEHNNDRGNAVGTLRIGDVIERRAKRWSVLDIRTTLKPSVSREPYTVSVYLKGPV
ncbi:MAG TPA: hypothetical protein VN875_05040 [Candidatus Binatus sp.]|jgi:hypothetical protein|nr:hypothetical protein [Candidatus Binatus sp.]